MKHKIKNFLFRIFCGFLLGISVVAPGVSGSIMAVMMGIYRDLINIASNPFKGFKKNFVYLLPLAIGALLSLLLSVKLLSFAFDTYPTHAYILFMGLIAGSMGEVLQQVRKAPFKWRYLIGVAAAFCVAWAVAFTKAGGYAVHTGQEDFNLWYLCLAGSIAGIVSVVPGMSISLILMLFGVYDYLLKTASSAFENPLHAASIAVPVGLCFVAGMILLSKLIKFVFDRHPGLAYFMVFGFMCGTLIGVFPNIPQSSLGTWVVYVALFLAGLLVSVGFQLLGKKTNLSMNEQPAE